MFLLTCHGTVMCVLAEGRGLAHLRPPVSGATLIELDPATQTQSHPVLGPITLNHAADGSIAVERYGVFLSARSDGTAAFVSDGSADWEHFQPISSLDNYLAPKPVPPAPATPLMAAQTLLDAGAPDAALAALEQAVEAHNDPSTWMMIGRLRLDAGNLAGAMAAWEECRGLEPGHAEATVKLAKLAADMRRPVTAKEYYQAALAAGPAHTETQLLLACRYMELRWWDLAEAAMQAITDPLIGWLAQTRRTIANNFEQTRTRLRQLETAFRRGDPFGEGLFLQLADASLSMGELALFRETLDQFSQKMPMSFNVVRMRANLALRERGLTVALAQLASVHPRFAPYPPYRLHLARLAHDAGAHDEVEALLDYVSAETPNAEGFMLLGMAALCRGDMAAAGRHARAWLSFDGGDCTAAAQVIAEAKAGARIAQLVDVPAGREPVRTTLVQFWDSAVPPADLSRVMQTWPGNHPEITHKLFDAASARDLIATHGNPTLVRAYDAARHPAMQSDIFRLVYLNAYGGIYMDADEACTRPMSRVFSALADVDLIAVQSGEAVPYIHNLFIAARPGCAIIADAIAISTQILAKHLEEGVRTDIWSVTGPGMLTRAIARFAAQPANAGRVLLLRDSEYRAFTRTEEDLAYKHSPGGNWRLA